MCVIFKSLFMAVQLGFFINALRPGMARINGPVRPSVWDLCRFGMTRPEPRPTTFISGQETLASVAYQGGSTWSMVGKQVETYCDLVILIGFKIMTCINIIYIIGFNGTRPKKNDRNSCAWCTYQHWSPGPKLP